VPGSAFSLFAPGLLPAAGPGPEWSPLDSSCVCSGNSAICIGRADEFLLEEDRFEKRLGPEACDVAGVINCALSWSEDNFLLFCSRCSEGPSSGSRKVSCRECADSADRGWALEIAVCGSVGGFDGVVEGLLDAPLAVNGVLDCRL
jgi:hypothetical protein